MSSVSAMRPDPPAPSGGAIDGEPLDEPFQADDRGRGPQLDLDAPLPGDGAHAPEAAQGGDVAEGDRPQVKQQRSFRSQGGEAKDTRLEHLHARDAQIAAHLDPWPRSGMDVKT